MSPKQVRIFIANWYKSFGFEQTEESFKERLRVSEARLLGRVETNASLRSLIRNPLICSLICFVNADRGGFVPDERAELYELATDTLIERRELERGIRAHLEIKLSRAQKFKILEWIAEFFFKKRSSHLSTNIVSDALKEFLPSLNILPQHSDAIVKILYERSLVLRQPTIGSVDFSHKTFLEYFYARRICEQNLFELTAEEFYDPDFREVFLFAMGIGSSPFVNRVIGTLLEMLLPGDDASATNILTLHAGINQATEVSPTLRTQAVDLLASVLPPTNVFQADELSAAGEVIIDPLMAYASEEHASVVPFVVRAILGTFSEHAIYSLRAFADLCIPDVDQILADSIDSVENIDTYKDIVLKHCRTLKSLTISRALDFDLLSSLPNIEALTVSSFHGDWSRISVPYSEKVVRLSLVDLARLQSLEVLKNFPALQELEIWRCPQITEFQEVGSCANLVYLKMDSLSIESTSFIPINNKIRHIDLSECVNIKDVSSLNAIFTLKSLYLPYTQLYDQISLVLDETEFELDDAIFDEEFFEGEIVEMSKFQIEEPDWE